METLLCAQQAEIPIPTYSLKLFERQGRLAFHAMQATLTRQQIATNPSLNTGVHTAPEQATSRIFGPEKLKVFWDLDRVQIPPGTPKECAPGGRAAFAAEDFGNMPLGEVRLQVEPV
jgi:hypothetical protein